MNMVWFLLGLIFVLFAAILGLWIFGERGHLMLPSTRHALGLDRKRKKGQTPRSVPTHTHPHPHPHTTPHPKPGLLDPLHAYVYARWTNQYISFLLNWLMPRMSEKQRVQWANSYHGKVLTPELAVELVKLDHDIDARDVEQIVPYPVARDIVLKNPIGITLYECACRHARENPCQPTNVCMAIGTDKDNFVVEHNPNSARRITQEEAIRILREEHERGHVHSAWFKDVVGGRMFAICNCCKCCCGGIEGMMKYGAHTMASSGYVATIDENNCTTCGVCVDVCPFDAISMERTGTTVNATTCMGCGVCASQCAFEGIALLRDPRKPEPLDVRVLA